MHLTTHGFRGILAVCMLSAAFPTPASFALDPTPRQSEAIYAELARHPEFKAADDALNVSYKQRTKGADSAGASKVKEEQRQWLKAMQAAVFNAGPGERLRLAVRMTQERTLALLGNGTPAGPELQKPVSLKADASRGGEERLSQTSLGLSPSSLSGDLAEFQKNLLGAIQALEKDSDEFFVGDDLPAPLSERAGLLLVASQNYLKASPAAAGSSGSQNDLVEKLSFLHDLVVRNAPEKKKADTLEMDAYERIEKKDFKGAVDCYRRGIQLLEQMELRLKTDMDVYSYFVKKSPPGSTFTKMAEAQWKGADYAGVIETVQKAAAVDERISKEKSAWVGEAQLLAAKALFKLKRHAEAEATAKEAVKLLDSTEYGSLREAKALLATIQKVRR